MNKNNIKYLKVENNIELQVCWKFESITESIETANT